MSISGKDVCLAQSFVYDDVTDDAGPSTKSQHEPVRITCRRRITCT